MKHAPAVVDETLLDTGKTRSVKSDASFMEHHWKRQSTGDHGS